MAGVPDLEKCYFLAIGDVRPDRFMRWRGQKSRHLRAVRPLPGGSTGSTMALFVFVNRTTIGSQSSKRRSGSRFSATSRSDPSARKFCHWTCLDLSRFRSGRLSAILAIKGRTMRPTDMASIQGEAFKRDPVRIATTGGLTRRQVAPDLEIGFSTLCKWVRAVRMMRRLRAPTRTLFVRTNSFGGRAGFSRRSGTC